MVRVMKTNLKHYLSSVYFANQPLHISGIFVTHHQCIKLVFITQIYRDARSTKRKILEWIFEPQVKEKRNIFMNIVTNLRGPWNAEKFFALQKSSASLWKFLGRVNSTDEVCLLTYLLIWLFYYESLNLSQNYSITKSHFLLTAVLYWWYVSQIWG
jgi:hypothetical protein